MKINVNLTIEIDPDEWNLTYGDSLGRRALAKDVREYVQHSIRDLIADNSDPNVTVTLNNWQEPDMTRKRSAARTEFLNHLLITALEGGINYWATIIAVDHLHDEQGRVTGYKSATIREKEHGDQEYVVTIDTMATGIRRLLDSYSPGVGQPLREANRTNGEAGDFDSLDADQALQWGIFNDNVYA